MNIVASRKQLRMGLVRRAAVTVPGVLLLGFASAGSVVAGSESGWYLRLAKPAGTPPDWVFPVAWGLVYAGLGLAAAVILNARGARLWGLGGRGTGLTALAAALVLAAAWMPVFFGAHRVGSALWIAVGMVAAGTVAALAFGRVRPAASWLTVPFLAWSSYAAALTWGIDRLNPDAHDLAPPPAASQVLR